MPVQEQTPYTNYTGNGVTTVFAYAFQVLQADDLAVFLDDVRQVGGYSVAGLGNDAGGTVTFSVAPGAGVAISLQSDVVLERTTDYQENGDLLAQTQDDDFDRIWLAMTSNRSLIGSAIRVPYPEQVQTLPKAKDRKDRLLAFDSLTGAPELSDFTQTQVASAIAAAYAGAAGPLDALSFIQSGIGAVSRSAQDKAREIVSLKDFGAVLDGVADDSAAMQAAINSLSAFGGEILVRGNALIGGIVVNTEGITIRGVGPGAKLTVKNGTTGVLVRQNFVNFKNILVISQGTKGDGLGTIGIHYEKTPVNSIGFVQNENLNIRNFSGDGIKVINAINFAWRGGFVVSCGNGAHFDRDAGAALFGTTVHLDDVYFSSCTNGLLSNHTWRSRYNVIAENCTYGIRSTGGTYTLFRCYFEGNTTLGVLSLNSEVQDLYSYSNNPVTDAVSITFDGAVAAANRGRVVANQYDHLAKRIGVLSNFGVDPKYFAGYGGTALAGLQFDENIVPLVRGPNLADPKAWASNRVAEFQGWDSGRQGYKIQGVSAGDTTYGQLQTVVLDNTKQYIIDVAHSTVAGGGITTIRCGALNVQSGVPFTPPANGANIIKCFGTDPVGTPFECYVHAFSIAEVQADTKQTAISQDKLTLARQGRSTLYDVAAPASGTWAPGEIVYNSAPTAGGFVGWVCVAGGTPGTWKTFGAISA